MENVPRLLRFRGGSDLCVILRNTPGNWLLGSLGYKSSRLVTLFPNSQTRLVLLEVPSHHPINAFDPLHLASTFSETNLRRIEASAPGGTWRDCLKNSRDGFFNPPRI